HHRWTPRHRTLRDQGGGQLHRAHPHPRLLPHPFPVILQEMSETASTPQPQQGVSVRVEDLWKSYAGVPVLKGIRFQVQRAEVFVIMGPSGSGKSVLLKHIIALEQPAKGDI